MVAGRANIEKAWQAAFAAGRTGIRYDIRQIKPEGDTVLVVGQFSVKVPEGGSLQDRAGNFVNVYQWDGGALKFRVHSFSFMPPPRP
jgi:ketosteroid isomerase-like protein